MRAAVAVALLTAVLGLATPRAGHALDPSKRLTQYIHETWQTEQGLPQNSVWGIAQSPDGYLWLGTQEGLVRFDGVRFRVWDSNNSPVMERSDIQAVAAAEDGSVWAGAIGGGLMRLKDGALQRYRAPEGLDADIVRGVLVDSRGRVWAGTYGAGTLLVKGDTLVEALPRPSGLQRRARHVREAPDGTIWIATDGGLARVDAGLKVTWLTTQDGLARDFVQALWAARDGAVWVGTAGGLTRLKDGAATTLTTRDGLPHDFVYSVRDDRDGNVWIGTQGGLARWRDGRVETFTSRDGLTQDTITNLFEDREGSLWIGTSGGGLNRFRDGRVTPITTREGLPHDFVRAINEDAASNVWIGTKAGLVRLGPGGPTYLTARDGLGHDYVRAILPARDGSLWVGTEGSLVRLRDGRFTSHDDGSGFAQASVRALLEDEAGRLWIGTFGRGVLVLDGDRWSTRPVSNDAVSAFEHDGAGGVLVATFGGGVTRIAKDGATSTIRRKDGLSSDLLLSILRDADGTLWIGTRGFGLNRVKDGRVTVYRVADGLFEDTIHQIVDDGRGALWMSSNKGLFHVVRRDLEAFATGAARRVRSVAYGTADGMRSAECNGGSQFAGCRTRSGHLLFPTIRGVVRVDPSRLDASGDPPPVLIEDVLADTRPSDGRLPAGAQALEVHYTSTALRSPARVRFRYRLAGFDEDWVDAGTRRTAYYTNLPPGDYRFEVVAIDEDGRESASAAALPVHVEPRLHQRTSFRLLLGLVCVGLLLGAYRARVWQLRARERELVGLVAERTRSLREEKDRTEAALAEAQQARREAEEASRAKSTFLANMSHELRTPLNGILGFAQLMVRRPGRDEEDRRGLDVIMRSGEHLLGLINDVLSLSKIEAGRVVLDDAPFELPALVTSTVDLLRARADARGLALQCEIDADAVPPVVRGDQVRVRQVLLNLLSNAVKFTDTGFVRLTVQVAGERIRFVVEDSGVGIEPAELEGLFAPFVQAQAGRGAKEGTGLGLALSRDLARLMGGDLTLASTPGVGTRATFELPLRAAEAGAAAAPPATRVVALAPGQEPPRILVADDVPLNRTVLCGLLRAVGFDVREAHTGEAAVAEWRAFRPHLIWMDKRMPGLDGLAATRAIREEERASGRPRVEIVALSASALEHERGEILAAGCDEFVPKPFRESTVFDVLRRRLGVRFLEEAVAPLGPAAVAPPAEEARVLVVDDDAVCREVARELLRSEGVAARCVASGEEALQVLAVDRFDLVLLDLHMPGMGGVETARRIKSDARLGRLPLVAMSAEHDGGDASAGPSVGMDGHVPKPVEPDALRRVLHRFLPA